MKKLILLFVTLFLTLACSNDNENKAPSEHDTPDEYWYTDGCDDVLSGTCCVINGSLFVEPNSTYTYFYSGNQDPSQIHWEVVSGDITLKKGEGTHRAVFYIGKDFTTGAIKAFNRRGLLCGSRIEITKLTK